MDAHSLMILDKVIAFADQAHGDQRRKYAPERYIEHPKRVMSLCSSKTERLDILAAAVLHDVLEDTDVSEKSMRTFLMQWMPADLAGKTIMLVKELTDVYVKSAYPSWNRRKRKSMELARLKHTSPDSQTIKYADIIDNSRDIIDADPDFARVFLHEYRLILKELDKGDPGLYAAAWKHVAGKPDQ